MCVGADGASNGYKIMGTRCLMMVTVWLMMVTTGGSRLFDGCPPSYDIDDIAHYDVGKCPILKLEFWPSNRA